MSNVTYADKNNSNDGSPESKFRAVDANEVKSAVNSKQDANANTNGLAALSGTGFVRKTGPGTYETTNDTGSHFLGTYTSLAALEAAHPTAEAGDEAQVDPGPGTDAVRYIWDVNDAQWVPGGGLGASTFSDLSGDPYDNGPLASALNAKENSLGYTPEDTSNKNANSGYAGLDSSGNVTKLWTTVLTGLVAGTNAVISAADTVLVAFAKLQAQITALVNAAIAKATQPEVDASTDDSNYITSLKLGGFMKKLRNVTTNWSVALVDRYGTVMVNSASATIGTIGATLGVDEWFVVFNKGLGNVSLVGSGVTLSGDLSVKSNKAVLVKMTSSTTAVCTGGSTVEWFDVLSRPTSISGYAITDGVEILATDLAVVGNATTVATDLKSYTIGANRLSDNAQKLFAVFAGNYAGNANNKKLEVLFDGTSIFDTTALAIASAASWIIEVEISRITSTTQFVDVKIFTSSSLLPISVNCVTATKNLANALVLKVVGTATANNDITSSKMVIYKKGI